MYNYDDGFPYKRLAPEFGDIHEIFRKLRNYHSNDSEGNFEIPIRKRLPEPCFIDQPLALIKADNVYELNKLPDYFTEYQRVRAKYYGEEFSPYEYYMANKDKFNGTVHQKREQLYNTKIRDSKYKSNLREANQFKITITTYIIDYFNCRKMLDFSSGWGDRLLGAIVRDIEYVGIDANKDLKYGHDEIIKTFGDKNKHRIIYNYAEDVNYDDLDDDFDICFTSPPFFNVEIYSEDIKLADSYVVWMKDFLFKVLNEVWKKIRVGGHLCIHFGDTKVYNLVEPMILYIIANLTNSQYIGYFGSGGVLIVGIYVFRKTEQSTDRSLENRIFGSYYPELI